MKISAFATDAGFRIGWALARRMGVMPKPGFELAFQAQVEREVGDAPDSLGRVNNNPLNLTAANPNYWPGQVGFASGGSATEHHSDFAVFATLEAGCEAAAENYMAGSYDGVRAAMVEGGDPTAIAQAIAESPWSTDHYPAFVDQVKQLAADAAANAPAEPQAVAVSTVSEAAYELIAPIVQEKVVAPQADTNDAIKGVLAQQAAAIARLAAAPDHESDAELADIVTKIGVGLEQIGASLASKGGDLDAQKEATPATP